MSTGSIEKRVELKAPISRVWRALTNYLFDKENCFGLSHQDFCHKTSRSIVSKQENKVIVLEDLRTGQIGDSKTKSQKRSIEVINGRQKAMKQLQKNLRTMSRI